MTDYRLVIESIVKGNLEDYRIIIDDHKALVGQIVFRLIQNADEREEICQDVFVKIYKNLSGFQFNSKLSTWIARIAFNTCVNYLKKRKESLYSDFKKYNSDYGDDEESGMMEESIASDFWSSPVSPDQQVMNRETSETLTRFIEALPKLFRTIITLYHVQDMSYGEIGGILNLPEGTVKSYLFRARRMLKEKLLSQYQYEDLSV
jgi:RNA polymerase sigma factor (sigma-70 family)